jgi:hypothetical protein
MAGFNLRRIFFGTVLSKPTRSQLIHNTFINRKKEKRQRQKEKESDTCNLQRVAQLV